MKPAADNIVVLITCGTAAEARRISRALVEQRLAACVNLLAAPVRSVYRWKGRVEVARERLLIVKSSRRKFAALCRQVLHLHNYAVPEVIALPIVAGSSSCLAWLDECLHLAAGREKKQKRK